MTTTAVIQTTHTSGGSRQNSLRRSPITSSRDVDSVRFQPARIETVSEKRNGDFSHHRSSSGRRSHLPDVSKPDIIHQSSMAGSPIELTEVDLTTVEEVPVLQRLPSVSASASAAIRTKKPQRVCKVL